MRKPIALSLMLLCSMGLVAGCGTKDTPATAAGKYPDKAITLIVPFAPGGSNDVMSRALGKVAHNHLGQNIIIKNLPGAGGVLGWNELVESQDDGYTLGTITTTVLLQPLYGTTGYHYPSAIDPLVQIVELPAVVLVRSDSAWSNINDLIDYAKQHPGDIKFGHGGLGAATHVVGEMIANKGNISLTQVPFKGEAEALAALLGGHVQFIITSPIPISEHVKSGKTKVLGIADIKRVNNPLLSDIPTLQEQGLDVVFTFWYGIGIHKGMPPEIKDKLLAGLEKTVNDPEYIENMRKLGMEVNYLGHEEFFQKWLKETRRLTKVVKESGIAEKIAEQKK
ncbi:Bug family tripartite tricarboxylate transporter substrate binding protein [Dendrosporobacter quercicolus]|nr:tripartite tricarboxylate transporter substrate binding protein [Dendrosporobacter quercicolus]